MAKRMRLPNGFEKSWAKFKTRCLLYDFSRRDRYKGDRKKNNPIPPCTNNVGTKLIEPRFTESISFEVH